MTRDDHYFGELQRIRSDDRRAFERACVLVPAQVLESAESGHATDCVVFDLSINGAKIRTGRPLTGESIKQLKLYGLVDYEVQLAWKHAGFAGLQFKAQPEFVAETLAGVLPSRYLAL